MISVLLKTIPRANVSILPTPLYKLKRLSDVLKINLFCMRDDMTGFAFGGNKTRKLDYLIGDALSKKANSIIAIGANQSNFRRLACAAAKVYNLNAYLILAGLKPKEPRGNLLVDNLFGANITHIDTDDDLVLTQASMKLEIELASQGHTVYRMPSGGSTPIGILGYVAAFEQITDYSEETGIHFNTIIHASGSGGTQAGLVVGSSITKTKLCRIIGISVGKTKEHLKEVVTDLAQQTTDMLEFHTESAQVITDDNYIGKCYGARTPEAREAIELFAQNEGIILDDVYTGKAAAGLIDYARNGKFAKGENVLFIHTGGNVQLFE